MKITNIEKVGRHEVYDVEVEHGSHAYILENGVVSHNSGLQYSSDTMLIMGRRQKKKGTDIVGYDFILNVDKGRFVKEKSQIPLNVSWEHGVAPYSGLIDIALLTGHITKPKAGWYARVNQETGEIEGTNKREDDLLFNHEFWQPILNDETFDKAVKRLYSLEGGGDEKEIVQFTE